ncbi:MAG: hypothetical protein E7128_05000 [Rikenellaceae bacterium]|nr:hypothetical protein [Rikenellaceae bacterium]
MKQRVSIPHAPMAIIATMFACGIIVAHFVELSLFVWVVIGCSLLLLGVLQSRLRWLFLLLSVASFGGANLQLRHTFPTPPQQTPIAGTVEISGTSKATTWGAWQCDADIVDWEGNRSNRKLKVTYSSDKPYPVGTRLKCKFTIKPITHESYARLLEVRGFEGYATLSDIQPIGHRTTLRYRAQRIQQAAVERIQRLNLTPNEEVIAEAMILGYRGNITQDLRQDYADTGSSHILAVSGLHVGIVFILINALLLLLPMVRYGHIAKNIAAIILIWAFAFVSGLSPSVIRAAIMFSLMQLGFALSVTNNSLNAICGAAFLMLAFDPIYLFDISFQLSYIAVLGITFTYQPLFNGIRSESRILNGIWSMLIVSLCASIAVMPLIAYTFGSISIIGILLSPAIVILAHISIITGLVWCMMPFDLMTPVVRFIMQRSLEWQNQIIGSTADLSFSALEWTPSAISVIIIYIVYLALCFGLRYFATRRTQPIVFE